MPGSQACADGYRAVSRWSGASCMKSVSARSLGHCRSFFLQRASPTGVHRGTIVRACKRVSRCSLPTQQLAPGPASSKVAINSTRGVHSMYKYTCSNDAGSETGFRWSESQVSEALPFSQASCSLSLLFSFYASSSKSLLWTSALPCFKPGNGYTKRDKATTRILE